MEYTPRDYQKKALDKIYADLQIKENVLLQGMMGCGKTFMSVRLIQRLFFEKPDMKFLVLMHKQELCSQFYQSFIKFTKISANNIGICCASLGAKDYSKRITIASIQSFINVMDKYSGAGLIIIDEAHRIDINKNTQYKKVIDYLRLQRPNCRLLGITATPARLGHGYIYGSKCRKGSINIFDDLSYKIKYEELRKEGFLVDLKGVVANHESLEQDLTGVAVNGDYVLDQLGEIMAREVHLKTAVDAIKKYCEEYNKICVFCCTIGHAEKLNDLLGDEATIVHSQLSSIDRANNMKSWVSGLKRIMVSVNILTEGFDLPELDCLVFARPTLSSTLFLQAVGRVLRPHKTKTHGLLVDLTDNTSRFGTDLDSVKVAIPKQVLSKDEKIIYKICPNCDNIVYTALRICPECEFEFPAPPPPIEADSLPEMKEVVFRQQPPVWKDVEDYSISIHTSKKTEKLLGKIDFFFSGGFFGRSRVSMFLCFQDFYSGFAVSKSEERWGQISDDYFPDTVGEFKEKGINRPLRVLVDMNGKYPELKGVECEKKYYEVTAYNDDYYAPPSLTSDYDDDDDYILPF